MKHLELNLHDNNLGNNDNNNDIKYLGMSLEHLKNVKYLILNLGYNSLGNDS